jgi:hypothetical protein
MPVFETFSATGRRCVLRIWQGRWRVICHWRLESIVKWMCRSNCDFKVPSDSLSQPTLALAPGVINCLLAECFVPEVMPHKLVF